MEEQPRIEVGVMEGYSRWAKSYDTTWNTLIATEELYSLGLLDGLAGNVALDVGAGTGRSSGLGPYSQDRQAIATTRG